MLAISSVVDNRARYEHFSQRIAIQGRNRPYQLETDFLDNVHERREQRRGTDYAHNPTFHDTKLPNKIIGNITPGRKCIKNNRSDEGTVRPKNEMLRATRSSSIVDDEHSLT